MLDREVIAALRDGRSDHEFMAARFQKRGWPPPLPPKRGRGRPGGKYRARDDAIVRAVDSLVAQGHARLKAFEIVGGLGVQPQIAERGVEAVYYRARRRRRGTFTIGAVTFDMDAILQGLEDDAMLSRVRIQAAVAAETLPTEFFRSLQELYRKHYAE